MKAFTEEEYTKAERCLLDPNSNHETMKLTMVRLGHDGTDRAMDVLSRAKEKIPYVLKGFFDCAWDECSYFNFISKMEEVKVTQADVDELIATGLSEEEMESQLIELEDELANRGVLVDLVSNLPIAIRLAYTMKLISSLNGSKYQGAGFVHFDGCGGQCDECVQHLHCDVAQHFYSQ